MNANLKTGRRVFADESGELRLAEGDYGFSPRAGCWQVRPFGHHAGSIPRHDVIEHEDGTITVSPSILLTDFDENGHEITWHGFLERGVWRKV